MNDKSPREALKVAMEKRILNEFGSKILNEERMDKVMHARKSNRLENYSNMDFDCECDDKECSETISMSTEEYMKMHHKTKYFVVVPSHVRIDLEEVISSFTTYALVAKYFPHSRMS
jgi:hypothetical protein